MSIQDRVTKIISEHLGIEPARVLPEAKLEDDLGADSLDRIELVMGVEEEFDISLDDAAYQNIHTVQQVVDLVAANQ